MSRPRIAPITIGLMLPMLLALGIWGTVTSRNYHVDANGRIVYEGTETYNTEAEGDRSEGVLFEGACVANPCIRTGIRCAECHTGGKDRGKETFTTDRHLRSYYQRFKLSLAEGQKLPWGGRGGYLTSRSGTVEYYLKDGTLDMIAPPGSMVLKDGSGRPFMLLMPGVPTLQPPKPR